MTAAVEAGIDWIEFDVRRTADDRLVVLHDPAAGDGTLIHGQDYVHRADYNVYPQPVESPSHGSRGVVTDPWVFTPVPAAHPSPFGWHDTNGLPGAEFTDTRGNNVNAFRLSDSFRPNATDWFDRQMDALAEFDVTLTFCFTPEHRGIAPHHTSPPQAPEEFGEFCAAMVRRYC